MKQEFYFHIPQPCHEDWDKMTTAAKGRFCESCSKNVVDFSLMTDNEVLNYFKNNSGKVCGRFANDQLQRPFIPPGEQKKKTWWVAMMMPFMLFSKQDSKSKNVIKQNVITLDTIPSQHILGKISAPNFHETKIDTIQCTGVTLGAPAIILPDTAEIIGDVDILEDTI